jgi:GNAT superfamily N-acetyltransferase
MEADDLKLTAPFDCGTAILNDWLQSHSWQNHRRGSARVYITLDRKLNLIAGYYSLSAAEVDREVAPSRVSKGLARYPVPVVLIGRLAIERRFQGSGLGRFLVRDAFRRILETADLIGVRAVMVRAKDDAAADFYRKLGFENSVSDPMLFFVLLKDVRKSFAAVLK